VASSSAQTWLPDSANIVDTNSSQHSTDKPHGSALGPRLVKAHVWGQQHVRAHQKQSSSAADLARYVQALIDRIDSLFLPCGEISV